jgi:phosphoglycerate-specific signal transduction histidine kinase
MTEETFQSRLAALEEMLRSLPPEQQARLAPLLQETRQRHELIKNDTAAAQDALDDWRLNMKYLLFTLEAQGRELEN